MDISKKSNLITSSPTRQLYNLAKEFEDTIDFTLGDPDISPNRKIKKAACKAIKNGYTRYTANAGLIELRNELSKIESIENKCNINRDNVIITVGGMEGLFLTFLSILDIDDEVIILAPYYVNYVEMVKLCGGKPIIIYTKKEDDFEISEMEFLKYISNKTKAIIINNPNNPTGHIYNSLFIKMIKKISKENSIYLLYDRVYKDLNYDHKEIVSIFDDESDNLIIIDSFSKKYCMTGYRIGYVIANVNLIATMTKLQENIVACASSISQYAALCALKLPMQNHNIEKFKKRRDKIINLLDTIPSISYIFPDGAFYVFVNISCTGLKSMDFCKLLLEEEHVAVAPGIAYGEKYDSYIRIAYTIKIKKIVGGIKKLINFIMRHSNENR